MTEIHSRIGNESKVPTEILDRIFGLHGRSSEDSEQITFLPKSCLYPLLSVCKRWRSVAERRLYMNVCLGCDKTIQDKDGNELKVTGREICMRFCETVQNNPCLASYVRELNLSGPDKLEDSRIRIDIIRNCKKVTRLSIVSFHSDHVDDLMAALAETDLVSLDLMHIPILTERNSRCFSLPMLFELLQRWPRIESVSATLGKGDICKYFGLGTGGEDVNGDMDFTRAAGACPSLRTIHLEADNFEPSLLNVVGDMAPNLEDVSIVLQNNRCNVALHRCLQIWSPSLTKLAVHTSLFVTFPRHERTALPSKCCTFSSRAGSIVFRRRIFAWLGVGWTSLRSGSDAMFKQTPCEFFMGRG
ncbi:hypothetical protein SCHPADRAFT_257267 [Schizopora paradoxa]|uniref:F-box domain-containing protein n=1 Tax=Schizopora paradoxa TaxID=27342 RepID=A0A0H2S1I7_9AGAM|nr:hypothetical protein SCHPADRAFT_257267 [Schizopora paradoxa]